MSSIALITGASSGIGLAFAKVFAMEGYDLILVARREQAMAELAAELQQTYGIKANVFAQDLTEPQAAQKVYDWTQQQGLSVDALVNNAGFGDMCDFEKADWQKLEGMILLNVLALSHLSHLYLPEMLARDRNSASRNGSNQPSGILNVASTAAFQPGPTMAVYFATKAYVLSLTEAIAAEVSSSNLHISVLCPGPTQSNFGNVANMGKMAGIDTTKADLFPTALTVAEYGYQQWKKPKVVAVHGWINKFLTFTPRLAPRALMRQGVKQFLKQSS